MSQSNKSVSISMGIEYETQAQMTIFLNSPQIGNMETR